MGVIATRSRHLCMRKTSSWPNHEVLRLPALSPTMEEGVIAAWNKKEGEAFSAGESICEVETDKATVDFEAQDDGVVAKILVQPGGSSIPIGTPIGVIVEEKSNVEAFESFTAADAGGDTGSEEQQQAKEEPVPPPPPTAPPPPQPRKSNAEETQNMQEMETKSESKPVASTRFKSSQEQKFPRMKSPLQPIFDAEMKRYENIFGNTLMLRQKKS